MIMVNKREIDYIAGMTVADALKIAGVFTDAMTLVVVDGILLPTGQPYRQLLTDGAVIRLLPIISGG